MTTLSDPTLELVVDRIRGDQTKFHSLEALLMHTDLKRPEYQVDMWVNTESYWGRLVIPAYGARQASLQGNAEADRAVLLLVEYTVERLLKGQSVERRDLPPWVSDLRAALLFDGYDLYIDSVGTPADGEVRCRLRPTDVLPVPLAEKVELAEIELELRGQQKSLEQLHEATECYLRRDYPACDEHLATAMELLVAYAVGSLDDDLTKNIRHLVDTNRLPIAVATRLLRDIRTMTSENPYPHRTRADASRFRVQLATVRASTLLSLVDLWGGSVREAVEFR
ncbi:hypothetical protein HLB23_15030 [Nocardia uniformis]|uniref:Uncharacterized protein n=1 Tax=Nocardia uniformis TaxID=53432 RepID=A0A849C496_9NOCA|nr:hypothetical protein [Nocardia uniformis]NNH71165.1 hypothetical protein [Nocardia uniformis]